MGQSTEDKSGQQSCPGCKQQRLGRKSPDDLLRIVDRPFQIMLADVGPGVVERFRRAFGEILNDFRTLLPTPANCGSGGVKASGGLLPRVIYGGGRLATEIVHLFRELRNFRIEH
jgi:hypothetical protein